VLPALMTGLFQNPLVDLVVLSRDDARLHPNVAEGIARQQNVRLTVHRVIGARLHESEDRLPAIVRARNEGKNRGTSGWLMFLDDDVVLEPHCVELLLSGLQERPAFAALAADYLGESKGKMLCPHVAMGATLFRRSALKQIEFRWRESQCECLCCCADLRRRRMGIGYLPQARARHIVLPENHASLNAPKIDPLSQACSSNGTAETGAVYILAAFDRRHCLKFQHRFLASLRAAGNQEHVLAFGYGLYPRKRREVERLPNVELIAQRSNDTAVPIRRLLDFQPSIERLPSQSIVAYWDAGDVIFQDRLIDLWSLARANPDRLLVVAEPFHHPENEAVAQWTLSIRDPDARRRAFSLLSKRPFLNSGFAAARAETMLSYLRSAHQLRHSRDLQGTADWGDQTALNLYCHREPSRFLAVDDRWNYCLCGRRSGEVQLDSNGHFVRRNGHGISVVHGNARTLNRYAFLKPRALARCCSASRLVV
jgi:hypothetical protein